MHFETHRYCKNNFSLKLVSELPVSKIIEGFSTNAHGIDAITLDMILLTIPRTLGVVTSIVNQLMQTGIFTNV